VVDLEKMISGAWLSRLSKPNLFEALSQRTVISAYCTGSRLLRKRSAAAAM
jgi:hypothetical protein